jgi:vacuolar protein sorting-associated protein 26
MFGGLFGANPTCELKVDGNPSLASYRSRVVSRDLPAYQRDDKVTGSFKLAPPPGKTVVHQGIILAVFGDYQAKTGEKWGRIFERVQHLAPPGELLTPLSSPFTFERLQFPTASYYGRDVSVVFGVELRVIRRMRDFMEQSEFLVFFFDRGSKLEPIHNEIGMTGVLHIEFIFAHGSFDCQDVVIGAAYLLLVKLRIVHMSISLYCQETFSAVGRTVNQRTVVKTIEVMDGAPVRGDNIPIRFFLGDCDIWPFNDFPDSALKVEWYLRAAMTDENGKRYYKRLRALIVRRPPDGATRA